LTPRGQWRPRRRSSDATHRWAAQLEDISANSFALDRRAPVDRRPASTVGVDGFTRHVSTAHGYSLSYPAGWTPMADAGAGVDLDVGTRDGSVRLGVEVRPAAVADADPRAVADREMAPYLKGGEINQPSTYTTIRLNSQACWWRTTIAPRPRCSTETASATMSIAT